MGGGGRGGEERDWGNGEGRERKEGVKWEKSGIWRGATGVTWCGLCAANWRRWEVMRQAVVTVLSVLEWAERVFV